MEIHMLGHDSYALFLSEEDRLHYCGGGEVDASTVRDILDRAKIPTGDAMQIELYELEGRRAVFVSVQNTRSESAALLFESFDALCSAAAAMLPMCRGEKRDGALFARGDSFAMFFDALPKSVANMLSEYDCVIDRRLARSHLEEHWKCVSAHDALGVLEPVL